MSTKAESKTGLATCRLNDGYCGENNICVGMSQLRSDAWLSILHFVRRKGQPMTRVIADGYITRCESRGGSLGFWMRLLVMTGVVPNKK